MNNFTDVKDLFTILVKLKQELSRDLKFLSFSLGKYKCVMIFLEMIKYFLLPHY